MKRLLAAVLAIVAFGACKPIQRPHTYDHDYPKPAQEFLLRWIGTPSGVALWVSTADDGEDNGRYQGIQFLVDPGSPTDVEAIVLPMLASNGLKKGSPLAYVVLTSGTAQAIAGAERVAKEFSGVEIVMPSRSAAASKGRPVALASKLDVGPEISARVIRPPAGLDALAVLIRFIDVQILLLPGHGEGLADAMAESIGETMEKEGLHTTLVYAANGTRLSEHSLEHLDPEVVAGEGGTPSMVRLALPTSGDLLQVGTIGSEMSSPGPQTRSRYAHWIDCGGIASCGADLALQANGPVVVPVTLAGQEEGLFLIDTKAPFSYLVRSRFEKIPGWEKAQHAGHSHGQSSIGLEVPGFLLSGGGRSVFVKRWHVLPIAPFQIGGKDIAGVIGLDLLQSFKLDLRPKERRILFTPNFETPRERLGPAESKTDGARATWDVPMDRSPSGPLILATMDGQPKSLVVDLAAEQTRVYVSPKTEGWSKVTTPSDKVLWAFDVPDEIDEATWKKFEFTGGVLPVKELNLFGAKFPDAPALAIDLPLETDVIGMDFLQGFDRVSLDFRRRSMVLERG